MPPLVGDWPQAAKTAHSRLNMRSLLPALLLLLFTTATRAEPIGWIERYVLAVDKAEPLGELIAGTRDHFYYHVLHDQTAGDLASAEKRLSAWNRAAAAVSRDGYDDLRLRQRLLTYGDNPRATTDFLIREFGVDLNDPPPGRARSASLPTELTDDDLAAMWDEDHPWQQWTRRGVAAAAAGYLADGQLPDDVRIDQLAGRIDFPMPGLERIVIDVAGQSAGRIGFGDLAAHRQLTAAQLAKVGERIRDYATDQDFVEAVLTRLQPPAVEDPDDLTVQRNHAARVVAYTATLPSPFDALKARSLHRLLELDLRAGEPSLERLLDYLRLPPAGPQPLAQRIEYRAKVAPLPQSLLTQIPQPGRTDEALILDYLFRFLPTEGPERFAAFFKAGRLAEIVAEVQLLRGESPPVAGVLTGDQLRHLTDRVEIGLSPQNPRQWGVDGPASLRVDLKNTPRLDVQIYQLDAAAVLTDDDRRIDTDLSLAGLLPTDSFTLTFDQPPIRRHGETIELPTVAGRGSWIVDLVSGRTRSRAVIQRGDLKFTRRTTPDGIRLTLIGGDDQPLAGQSVMTGGRRWTTGADGVVTLPHVAESVRRQVVIGDAAIARRVDLDQPGEGYELVAGMHFNAVVAGGGNGSLLVRPELRLAGEPVSRSVADDWSLEVTSVDAEGNRSSRRYPRVDFESEDPIEVEVSVGPMVRSIAATLTASVRRLSDGEVQILSESRDWPIATSLAADATDDVYLTAGGDNHVAEVRGRTGEPVAGAAVELELTHVGTGETITTRVQSGDRGRANLGTLNNVSRLRFRRPGGDWHRHDLINTAHWPSVVQSQTGAPVALPVVKDDGRYAAFEIIGGAVAIDVSASLQTRGGLLTFDPGQPGTYRVVDLTDGRGCDVTLVAGPVVDSQAVGEVTTQTVGPATPVSIASAGTAGDRLKIQLAGGVDGATVSIIATRYFDGPAAEDALTLPAVSLERRRSSPPPSGYVSGIAIGDEEAYVLRRRDRRGQHGVMTPPTSLLLAPWVTDETDNDVQRAEKGENMPAMSAPSEPMRASIDSDRDRQMPGGDTSPSYQFLRDGGVAVHGLTPRCRWHRLDRFGKTGGTADHQNRRDRPGKCRGVDAAAVGRTGQAGGFAVGQTAGRRPPLAPAIVGPARPGRRHRRPVACLRVGRRLVAIFCRPTRSRRGSVAVSAASRLAVDVPGGQTGHLRTIGRPRGQPVPQPARPGVLRQRRGSLPWQQEGEAIDRPVVARSTAGSVPGGGLAIADHRTGAGVVGVVAGRGWRSFFAAGWTNRPMTLRVHRIWRGCTGRR